MKRPVKHKTTTQAATSTFSKPHIKSICLKGSTYFFPLKMNPDFKNYVNLTLDFIT